MSRCESMKYYSIIEESTSRVINIYYATTIATMINCDNKYNMTHKKPLNMERFDINYCVVAKLKVYILQSTTCSCPMSDERDKMIQLA